MSNIPLDVNNGDREYNRVERVERKTEHHREQSCVFSGALTCFPLAPSEPRSPCVVSQKPGVGLTEHRCVFAQPITHLQNTQANPQMAGTRLLYPTVLMVLTTFLKGCLGHWLTPKILCPGFSLWRHRTYRALVKSRAGLSVLSGRPSANISRISNSYLYNEQIYTRAFVFTCLFVCKYICMCVCVYARVYPEVNLMCSSGAIFFSFILAPVCFKTRSLSGLGLPQDLGLAGKWVPGICLSALTSARIIRTFCHAGLVVSLWELNLSPVYGKYFANWVTSASHHRSPSMILTT